MEGEISQGELHQEKPRLEEQAAAESSCKCEAASSAVGFSREAATMRRRSDQVELAGRTCIFPVISLQLDLHRGGLGGAQGRVKSRLQRGEEGKRRTSELKPLGVGRLIDALSNKWMRPLIACLYGLTRNIIPRCLGYSHALD